MSIPMPLRQPWLRLPEETAQQYEAFEHYRDLGASRSLELVINQLLPARALMDGSDPERRQMLRNVARNGQLDTDTPFGYQVMTWSNRYRWAFRAEQFDRHVAMMASEKIASEHAAMLQRHVAISIQLQEKALQRLRAMDASELSSKEVLAYLKDAVMLERVSREMPRPTAGRSEITTVGDPEAQGRKELADVFSILVQSGALPEGADFDMAEGIIDAKAHAVYGQEEMHEVQEEPAADG